MIDAPLHGIYGSWPPSLRAIPAGATQFSPLLPGSQMLEAPAQASLASMIMHAPPGTLERRYAFACALRAMPAQAPFTVLARKDKGGRRMLDELRHFGCEVDEIAQSHYRICTTVRPLSLVNCDEPLALGGPQQLVDGTWSQPGVFSWDRLDIGSALLLAHLPELSGRGADLGAGIGTLARAVLANNAVTQLFLVEIDRRAIAAAQKNIRDARAEFIWADIQTPLPMRTALDFVVMNPPFHSVGVEDKALGQAFVARAASMLKPGGVCWLTANRHLPYENVLSALFSSTRFVAEADGFKIYAGVK